MTSDEHMNDHAALFAQWQRIISAVEALQPEDWASPTRLGDWSVKELVAHLAGNPWWLTRCASELTNAKAKVDAQSYFDTYDAGDVDRTAKNRAEESSPDYLIGMLRATTAEAIELIATMDPAQVICGGDAPITFADMTFTRVVEAVVHGLDLAAATGSFEQEPAALKVVARWCAQRLERTHKGRTIEVRIPPVAAVQIAGPQGDGPRHKRGTPPNTVETDPTTWIELATGRVTWSEAVAAHRVSASGRLADLDWALPVLA